MKILLSTIVGMTVMVWAAPESAVQAAAQEAQSSVSLEQAMELFGQNSPELQLARNRYRAALGEIRQGRAVSNPSIAGTHESVGDYTESYLTLTQSVDFLWERSDRTDRARALEARARATFLADSARLALEVKRAYLDAWTQREALAAYEQAEEVMEDLVSSAEARFAEGDLAGYDLRRLRLEHLQLTRRSAAAALDLEDAERRLGAYLQDPEAYGPLSARTPPTPQPPALPRDDLMARALGTRPDLQAADALAEALDASTNLAGSSAFRGTSVTGGWKRQTDGLDGLFVGLEVPLPLVDRRQGAVEAARGDAAAAESEADLLRRTIARQVSLAAARLETARRQSEILGSGGGSEARELLDIARLSFEEGEMRSIDLLDAVKAFIEAQLLDSQIRSDLWNAYYELEQAVGGFSTLSNENTEGENER